MSNNPFFAQIQLPLATGSFTYAIPSELERRAKVGCRVLVNFGKRKLYTGIITDLVYETPNFEVKPVIDIIDDIPIINKYQFLLWKWIAEYYCCTNGEILKAALPSTLIPSSETIFAYQPDCEFYDDYSEKEKSIINYLKTTKQANLNDIFNATNIENTIPVLQKLVSKGLVLDGQSINKAFKPKIYSYVKLNLIAASEKQNLIDKIKKRYPKQYEIIKLLQAELENGNEYVEQQYVLKTISATSSSLASLQKNEFIEIVKKEESVFNKKEDSKINIDLSLAQQKSYDQINLAFEKNKTVLLHGVTSSGKTEIYIKLIEDALKTNSQVLYLLPEIALTTQIVNRLKKHFGDQIGVYHSKYTQLNRANLYDAILKQKKNIILGARSAIFLPFSNLGLIIVDEEHDTSYKQQDPDPRYNARDVAVFMAKKQNANIILGSATPSVESYHNCEQGKYSLVELTERYGNVSLPKVEIVDLKDAYKRKIMQKHFHPELINNIRECLMRNEQIILFQNRRGYAPFVECKTCGWVPKCKNCDVSLTLHKYDNSLVCHYCGEKYPMFTVCSSCRSLDVITKGLGTEKIEDEVKELFPSAVVARLDYDVAKSKLRYEKIISEFAQKKIDILVGTQIITKGLDFENLSLVGVLNADNMLSFPDFRAFEKTFHLLTQVSGRAGRRSTQGKVIIQSYNPDHQILQYVLKNDYETFFKEQVAEREFFKYPPLANFIEIKIKHRDKDTAAQCAELLARNLKSKLGKRLVGPQDNIIGKISNFYIKTILIRYEKQISSSKLKDFLQANLSSIKTNKNFSSIVFEVNVDPLG